ncbi:response regulator [Stutzerimonas kirkiae]|uniref:Two-component system response regulator n=1 Tax=Stutzerimonas kirkiae TaxID=2211392 RepID=A0A4V6MXE3_9GAMM|nr:two-component system response regulator [Stutzerimonas kirkiae]TBV00070.1 two-component system response regulator [Stutzerimonas kirkiae]TBV05776.1 two-component system response regulator [Stutzerimonas kirkiae]TBV09571.1 two-component system response regulator [Stutzerimonas kirkiae]TBV17347.1 two-component system response regulator [Stutzerimonas kirkiae]
MNAYVDSRRLLLLVDDEPTNLQVLFHTLKEQYRLLIAKDGAKALELARGEQPDLILLDVMMPGMDGYEVCQRIKGDPLTSNIPVIFVTALAQAADEEYGLELGAVDYISKPFNPGIVKARVRTHLSLVQADMLRQTRLQIVQRLCAAAEFKDNETSQHTIRVGQFSRALALAVGYGEAAAEDLLHSAPMHDVGKIGIPDAILCKPGKLTAEEWDIMRGHTHIGARIIGEHAGGLLQQAAVIALNHHEKWDGSGYPAGLTGEAIPHVARIVAIVDVFDALTSSRPYKRAWPVEEALAFIREQSGAHFDPELVEAFFGCLPQIQHIRQCWADSDAL